MHDEITVSYGEIQVKYTVILNVVTEGANLK